MAFNLSGLFDGMGSVAGGMLGQPQVSPQAMSQPSQPQDPYSWINFPQSTNPTRYKPLLERAGLWDGFTDMPTDRTPARGETFNTDWARLAGYQLGTNDINDIESYALRDPQGNIVGEHAYKDDGIGLDDWAKGAAYVAALSTGLPAAFEAAGLPAAMAGASGSAGAAGASVGGDGLMFAGQYGGAGSLGEASLLTGGSAGAGSGLGFGSAAAGVGEGLSLAGQYGSAGSLGDAAWLTGATPPAAGIGGIGTLGSLPEVPAPSQPLPTNAEAGITPATPASLPAAAAPAAGGGLLESLISNPRLVAGVAGGLLGGAEGGGGDSPYTGPMPTITRGGWSASATPTYSQPAAQPQGMNVQPGQANSGLWRYMLGGGQ